MTLGSLRTYVAAQLALAAGITQLTGDVTAGPGSGSQAATLATTGVVAGTYGSASQVGQFTVDAKGRLTVAANVTITPNGLFTEQTTTATGTQNNVDLSARLTHLRCNNASALVLTGFQVASGAPQAGDRFILDNVGSSTVRVAHQDAGSTAANRAICASTNGQIIGATGRMIGVYDDTTDRWRVTVVEPGTPVAVAHGDLTFTTSGGGWTVDAGDLATFKYVQRGQIIEFFIVIADSSVVVAGISLQINGGGGLLPGGFDAAAVGYVGSLLGVNAGGTEELGLTRIASGNTIALLRQSAASWSTSTNTTDVETQFSVRVA